MKKRIRNKVINNLDFVYFMELATETRPHNWHKQVTKVHRQRLARNNTTLDLLADIFPSDNWCRIHGLTHQQLKHLPSECWQDKVQNLLKEKRQWMD